MNLLTAGALALACTLMGGLLIARSDRGGWGSRLLTGCVLLHLVLNLLDATPLLWNRLTIGLPLLALGTAGYLKNPPFRALRLIKEWGWGSAVAGLSVLGLATLVLARCIAAPDYIYHWGLKGKKFALAGGVDYEFLAKPWNGPINPDYPNLVPELFAVLEILGGSGESSALLWSVIVFAALLATSHRLLIALSLAEPLRQASLAFTSLALLGFSVSWQMVGNADGMIALALTAGALCLLDPPTPNVDWRLGSVAAFAAATKFEGAVLGGFLLLLYLGRRAKARELGGGVVLRAVLLPALVVVPWWLMNQAHHLGLPAHRVSWSIERLPRVAQAIFEISVADGWHGVSLLCLLALPVLLAFRRRRLVALLCCLQVAFYLFAYATSPVDTVFLVRSSFPRVMMHVVPVTLALLAAALPAATCPTPPNGRIAHLSSGD